MLAAPGRTDPDRPRLAGREASERPLGAHAPVIEPSDWACRAGSLPRCGLFGTATMNLARRLRRRTDRYIERLAKKHRLYTATVLPLAAALADPHLAPRVRRWLGSVVAAGGEACRPAVGCAQERAPCQKKRFSLKFSQFRLTGSLTCWKIKTISDPVGTKTRIGEP